MNCPRTCRNSASTASRGKLSVGQPEGLVDGVANGVDMFEW